MHLLYITFGKEMAIHIQAAFSICSFLTQPKGIASINVITDEPSYYTHLQSKIKITALDAQTLREWKGPHDFFWRIKIMGIALLCERHPGEPVVYLDTDSFLFRQLSSIQSVLEQGSALMHTQEGPLAKAASKTEKIMWSQVKNRLFAQVQIQAHHSMWNAGVVASPNTRNGADILLALQLCDEMCAAGVTRRLIEQFALSVALQELYGLQPAAGSIAHYWSNKEAWNAVISNFFMQSYLQDLSLQQTIDLLKDLDFSQTPVEHRTTNTHRRLQKRIDNFFPARGISFVKNRLRENDGKA